jgi:hypothetical protein
LPATQELATHPNHKQHHPSLQKQQQ